MQEKGWKYVSILLTVAVIVAASIAPAGACPTTKPVTEGPRNCRQLNALGSPVVCEGEAPEVVEATDSATVPVTTPEIAQVGGHSAVAPPYVASTEASATEICFPVADWSTEYGASAEDRPCDVLRRPQEDGSTRLMLGTVGADAATCLIPNPYEERGRFVVHCRRLPNR